MQTITNEGKQFAKITELKNWDRNPRGIKVQDFERLKTQIKTLGQYKPLLVTPEGEVLGGNMRLKAYESLGIQDIWVSIVEPKSEAQKLEYALSDNDRAGYYEDDKLAELINEFKDQIPLDLFKVDLANNLDLDVLLRQFGPDTSIAGQGEQIIDEKTWTLKHKCPKCGFEF